MTTAEDAPPPNIVSEVIVTPSHDPLPRDDPMSSFYWRAEYQDRSFRFPLWNGYDLHFQRSIIVGNHTITLDRSDSSDAQTRIDMYTAIEELQETIERLDYNISLLDDNTDYPFRDIYNNPITVKGSTIKAYWNAFDFVVTDQDFGPNRGGSTQNETSGRISDNIKYTTITGYGALNNPGNGNSRAGLNFIILHELAHGTPSGQTANAAAYQNYFNGNNQSGAGYSDIGQGSQQFESSEAFANTFATTLAGVIGVDVNMGVSPPHGYLNNSHL